MKISPLSLTKSQRMTILLSIFTFVAVAIFMYHGLRWSGFWYDESVQYWMSRGLPSNGVPLQTAGGLADAIKQNGIGNLDPGGFTILLHYWLLVGKGIAWQRALPLVFFAIGIIGLGYLGWRWKRDVRFALFSLLVPAAFPMLLEYANEVRAYSMEFAGVICAFLLLDLLIEKPRLTRCLVGGLVIGFFLTSRYSYLFVAIAMSGVFCGWISCQNLSLGDRFRRIFIFLMPVIISGVVILFSAFMPQYEIRMQPNNGEMIGYLYSHKLQLNDIARTMTLLAGNIFTPGALPLVLGSVIFLLLRRRMPEVFDGENPSKSAHYILTLIIVMITAVLWKWHPWNFDTKWSCYLHAVSAIMIVRMIADLWSITEKKGGSSSFATGFWQKALTVSICVLGAVASLYRRSSDFDLVPVMNYLDGVKPKYHFVAVDMYSYPTFRYFCDEGPFSGRDYYPRAFRMAFHGGHDPLIGPKTRYIVTHRKLEELRKSYPDVVFVDDPKLPDNIVRIQPPPQDAEKPAKSTSNP